MSVMNILPSPPCTDNALGKGLKLAEPLALGVPLRVPVAVTLLVSEAVDDGAAVRVHVADREPLAVEDADVEAVGVAVMEGKLV